MLMEILQSVAMMMERLKRLARRGQQWANGPRRPRHLCHSHHPARPSGHRRLRQQLQEPFQRSWPRGRLCGGPTRRRSRRASKPQHLQANQVNRSAINTNSKPLAPKGPMTKGYELLRRYRLSQQTANASMSKVASVVFLMYMFRICGCCKLSQQSQKGISNLARIVFIINESCRFCKYPRWVIGPRAVRELHGQIPMQISDTATAKEEGHARLCSRIAPEGFATANRQPPTALQRLGEHRPGLACRDVGGCTPLAHSSASRGFTGAGGAALLPAIVGLPAFLRRRSNQESSGIGSRPSRARDGPA